MGGPLGAKQNVMDRPNRTWPSEFPKRSVGGRPAMDESLEARSLSHPGRVSEVARWWCGRWCCEGMGEYVNPIWPHHDGAESSERRNTFG